MKDFLKHLNKEQYEAATTINGPLLIIAGAGTGKTQTLVSRIANMIDEGIEPSSILLLTFTNKAAKEMKDRIAKNIGPIAADVTASTFHSFCAAFLRKHSHLISINNSFTIIDGSDAAEAMGIARDEFVSEQKGKGITYNAKDFPDKKTLLAIHSHVVNNCENLEDVVSVTKYDVYYNEIKAIIDRYILYKKEHAMMNYDDLLYYTKKVLTTYENVRCNIGEKYKYVCCDEYQDTNILQDEILNLICRDHQNLAVVGDENQSIYKFRGARIENILTFSKRHPGCKTIVLHENYRSSQEILDLSNSMMEYALEGTKKTLHGQFNGSKPQIIITETDSEENFRILKEIQKHYSNGVPLKEMAVIVRSSAQSYGLETMLNRSGIPYNKFGGIKFLEKIVVRDILSFLRIIVNERDEIALYRVLQLYPGIGKGYSSKITAAVANDGLSILNTLYPKTGFHQYLVELYNVINDLKDKDIESQLKYLLEDYYPKTAERSINLSKSNEGVKLENKKKLFESISDAKNLYSMAKKYNVTSKFLEDIILESTVHSDDEDKLNITTIHSAKGLEYDIVFIMDVVEHITPKCRKGDDEDSEELRCFYVALTRARKELYLYAPMAYMSGPLMGHYSSLSHYINYDDVLSCFKSSSYNLEKIRTRCYN